MECDEILGVNCKLLGASVSMVIKHRVKGYGLVGDGVGTMECSGRWAAVSVLILNLTVLISIRT